MDDLISRQAAIDAVTAWVNKALNPINQSKYNEGEIAAYETTLSELKKIPSAMPKTGRWIEMVDADPMTGEPYVCGVYCSECGERIGCESNFCPNCGAYMRGDNNGEMDL